MATITKRGLVMKVSDETGKTQEEVLGIVQKLLDTVTASLANNDEIVLRNFGTFQVKETKAKVGRNPNNPNVNIKIPPRAVVKFHPGKVMKEKVAKLLPELHGPDTPLQSVPSVPAPSD